MFNFTPSDPSVHSMDKNVSLSESPVLIRAKQDALLFSANWRPPLEVASVPSHVCKHTCQVPPALVGANRALSLFFLSSSGGLPLEVVSVSSHVCKHTCQSPPTLVGAERAAFAFLFVQLRRLDSRVTSIPPKKTKSVFLSESPVRVESKQAAFAFL